jgi:glycosyltransferase involved in cell wall biosynthesis
MIFHILGLSHTKTIRAYSCCAFTQKVRLLCKMLTEAGHTVYHYGTEGSDPICTEHIDVLSHENWLAVHGDRDWKRDGFNVSIDTPAQKEFVKRSVEEIGKRVHQGDFLLCTFGIAHQEIANVFPYLIVVESGIGYPTTFAKFRVFESYAWMHFHYGKEGKDTSPHFYDAVIPNYLDLDDYQYQADKQNYCIFVGRLNNHLKGAQIASDVCLHLGVKLYTAGQGGPVSGIESEYLGVLGIEERAKWVSHAKALFCPTYYIEPFGTVAIESMAYGTPVITTDFGAFTETVLNGITGYRCRTFEQFVWAAENIDRINPADCRRQAEKYGLNNVVKMYEEYFSNVTHSFDKRGWYYMSDKRNAPWILPG